MNFKYFKAGSVITFILILSVLSGWLMHNLVNPLLMKMPDVSRSVIDYTGFLCIPAMISLGLYLVNEYGWRYRIFKWLVDVPDMRGRYTGKIISVSSDGHHPKKTETEMVMEIVQNASKLVICCFFHNEIKNDRSFSKSATTTVFVQEDESIKVNYIFLNHPDSLAHKNLHAHEGTAYFIFYSDKKISGEYYNEEAGKGQFNLAFKSKKLIHRFN